MSHMKNQASVLSNPFPSLDNRLKNWFRCGGLMAKLFTFNSTNVISYIVCSLPVLQDYCLFYYQVYDWASNENNVD